jgi:hypothetical protein
MEHGSAAQPSAFSPDGLLASRGNHRIGGHELGLFSETEWPIFTRQEQLPDETQLSQAWRLGELSRRRCSGVFGLQHVPEQAD